MKWPKNAGLLVLLLFVSGCASMALNAGFDDVRAVVGERSGSQLFWNNDTELDKEAAEKLDSLLKRKLTAEDAVQIALLNNRELQATYSDLGVAQADLVQAGLLSNPIFDAAVMFPISLGRGSVADRELQPDDIAGVSDLYPDRNFQSTTGGLRGRVLRGAAPVRGAHVVAFNMRTRALVSGFSFGDAGEFQILGLKPGPYVVRVEPLDDADIDSFFEEDAPIEIDFSVTFYPRLVAAPSGGVSDGIDVVVRPK